MKKAFLFVCLAILMANCKKDSKTNSAKTIGQTYQGGIVFYVDASGQHGFIAAPSDQSIGIIWGCSTNISGAAGITTGTGQANTKAISTACNNPSNAALLCETAELGGYTDWFLPGKDELNLMYQNLFLKGKGNFGTSNHYWSSTQFSMSEAWVQTFQTGDNTQNQNQKDNEFYVRMIRAF